MYNYYCDDGVSDTTFDRRELNRLVQDATGKKINLVLCKDLSRLGRDYIEAGKYTDLVFPSLGCRVIVLNDGVDTMRKNNEMLVILKNVMNDFYARGTSNKIKAVKQSTFKAGKYVGCYAPLGYRKERRGQAHPCNRPGNSPSGAAYFRLALTGLRLSQDRAGSKCGKGPGPSETFTIWRRCGRTSGAKRSAGTM